MKIRTPQNTSDIERLIDFCRLVQPTDHPHIFNNFLQRNPFISPESHYFIEKNNQIIAMTSLLPHRQFLGEYPLSVGEIGLVGTHPNYRKQGYARLLLEHILSHSAFTLVYLYGIPDFYERFAFSYAVPSTHARIHMSRDQLAHLPQPEKRYRVREYQPHDLEAIKELYYGAYKQNNCAEERSHEYWLYCIQHLNMPSSPLQSVLNMRGEIQGYIWWKSQPQWGIREAVSLHPDASLAILKEAWMNVRNTTQASLGIQVPINHDFARHCSHHGAAFQSFNHLFYGVWGGMYRIINLEAVLKHMIPILSKRLKHSCFYNRSGGWAIRCDEQMVALYVKNGQVIVNSEITEPILEIPRPVMTPLITGYRGFEIVEANQRLISQAVQYGGGFQPCYGQENIAPEEIAQVMHVLFPESHPYISEIDNVDELAVRYNATKNTQEPGS